jgi:hypothetical protein
MEPANKILTRLGGPTAVAKFIGVHRVTVSKWQSSRESGGTGGMIPMRQIPRLMDMAKSLGIALDGNDFLPFASNGGVAR